MGHILLSAKPKQVRTRDERVGKDLLSPPDKEKMEFF
jgi:hypothetical protein